MELLAGSGSGQAPNAGGLVGAACMLPRSHDGLHALLTGQAPYSNAVLVSNTLTNPVPCPPSGTAPPTFTFAIQNTGNGTAYPSIDIFKDMIGLNYWATIQSVVYDPPNPPVQTWLYAGLLQPLRRRIQNVIDRRFYRHKYDAAKTLAAFGATLRSEVDLDQLCERIAAVVQETMQLRSVSLWLRPSEQTRKRIAEPQPFR